MHSVAKRSNPADLQKLPLLHVVLAVSLALITPAGTSSGEVLLRSVHSDRVRSHEISASSLLLPHVRLVRKAALIRAYRTALRFYGALRGAPGGVVALAG